MFHVKRVGCRETSVTALKWIRCFQGCSVFRTCSELNLERATGVRNVTGLTRAQQARVSTTFIRSSSFRSLAPTGTPLWWSHSSRAEELSLDSWGGGGGGENFSQRTPRTKTESMIGAVTSDLWPLLGSVLQQTDTAVVVLPKVRGHGS